MRGMIWPIDQSRSENDWIEQGLPPDYASGAVLEEISIDGLEPVGDSLALEAVFSTPVFAARDADALRFRPGMITASGLPDLFRPGPRPTRFDFASGCAESFTWI